MKFALSIKALYRSKVRTLLTAILLGVVSFAFYSQMAEYAIIMREINSAAGRYAGIGAVEIEPPKYSNPSFPGDLPVADSDTLLYKKLTRDEIAGILELPHITSADLRYMTAGISDYYARLDEGALFYDFAARNIYEATLVYSIIPEQGEFGYGQNRLVLGDIERLAGRPTRMGPYVDLTRNFTLIAGSYPAALWEGNEGGFITAGGGRSRAGQLISLESNSRYGTEFVQGLTPKDRYVFVTRGGPVFNDTLLLGDHLSNTWCEAVWSISGEPDDYIEMEMYGALRELIGITDADAFTYDVVYTDDMRAIRRFSEGKMTIIDGRALTAEDSGSENSVCVISSRFADINKVSTGDKLTLSLGKQLFEQYKNLGAVAAVRERYAPPEKMVTLEIVGIYADTDGTDEQLREPHWSYSVNTVFVPKSLLPVDESELYGHAFAPGEFSFIVGNAWDIPAFFEETAPLIEEMGFTLFFHDGGWPEIAGAFQTAREFTIIKIAAFSAAVVAATFFAVYLFIDRKKKEYAIMRALGTPRNISARALLWPLMTVAGLSSWAGSGAAWLYTAKTVADNDLFAVLEGVTINTSVPAGTASAYIIAQLLLTLLIALAMLRRISARAPLTLLHSAAGAAACTGRRGRPENSGYQGSGEEAHGAMAYAHAESIQISKPEKRADNYAARFAARYIWRHARRAAGKSLMAFLLAALLIGATSQLAFVRHSYLELYRSTTITANYIRWLRLTAVTEIIDSGYFIKPYYEARRSADMYYSGDLVFSGRDLVATNDIARYTGDEVEITFAGGYDISVMEQFGDIIIVGETLAREYGLELGGTVMLTPEQYLSRSQNSFIARHRYYNTGDTITDMEILEMYSEDIAEYITDSAATLTCTIAGIIRTPSSAYNGMVFTPGSEAAPMLFSSLRTAEFTLADNLRVNEARELAETYSVIGSFTMDTSMLENPSNTMRLLMLFYPIAVAAALLIGGFLCCLTILRSSKEAALMRALGTTRIKIKTILSLEQIFISAAGLITGCGALLIYNREEVAVLAGQIAIFAAMYVFIIMSSGLACSALATRRSALELLQAKE